MYNAFKLQLDINETHIPINFNPYMIFQNNLQI